MPKKRTLRHYGRVCPSLLLRGQRPRVPGTACTGLLRKNEVAPAAAARWRGTVRTACTPRGAGASAAARARWRANAAILSGRSAAAGAVPSAWGPDRWRGVAQGGGRRERNPQLLASEAAAGRIGRPKRCEPPVKPLPCSTQRPARPGRNPMGKPTKPSASRTSGPVTAGRGPFGGQDSQPTRAGGSGGGAVTFK